ncbi:hypothetical protein DIPPA_09863 [Diplonema papillatum]|nr:hypothetical protein DIPPA_09863 [Diplonema papillatum]
MPRVVVFSLLPRSWEEADVTLLSQPRSITTAAAEKLGANPLRNAAYRTRLSPVKRTWSPGGGCCGSIRRQLLLRRRTTRPRRRRSKSGTAPC